MRRFTRPLPGIVRPQQAADLAAVLARTGKKLTTFNFAGWFASDGSSCLTATPNGSRMTANCKYTKNPALVKAYHDVLGFGSIGSSDGVPGGKISFDSMASLHKLSELLSGAAVALAERTSEALPHAGQRRCVGKGLKAAVLAKACSIPAANHTHHTVAETHNWAQWDEAEDILAVAFHTDLDH
jgi:hypothetical protein